MARTARGCGVLSMVGGLSMSACVVGMDDDESLDDAEGRTSATLRTSPEEIWAGGNVEITGCGFPKGSRSNPTQIQISITAPGETLTVTTGVDGTGCLQPAGALVTQAATYAVKASSVSSNNRTTLLASGSFTAITPPASSCQMSFAARAPYPVSIQYNAMIGIGDSVYSFGGVVNNAYYTAASYRYDPATDAWTPIAPLPTMLLLPAATTDGTHAFIAGPPGDNQPTALLRYDPATDSYTTLRQFDGVAGNPDSDGSSMEYLDGKVYYLGGAPANWYCTGVQDVRVYDVATDTWSSAATFPSDMTCLMSATSFEGSLYVAGGIGLFGGTATAHTYVYDPGANAWSDPAMANLPQNRGGAASGWVDGQWFLAGGATSDAVISWDPQSNRWTRAGALTASRPASASLGSSLLVVGGASTSTLEGSCP